MRAPFITLSLTGTDPDATLLSPIIIAYSGALDCLYAGRSDTDALDARRAGPPARGQTAQCRHRREEGAPGRHRFDETAALDITKALVDVPRGPVRRVDVEDDEIAALEQVSGHGHGHCSAEAAPAVVWMGEDVADYRHTFGGGVNVGPCR